jgi:hypothetical protein
LISTYFPCHVSFFIVSFSSSNYITTERQKYVVCYGFYSGLGEIDICKQKCVKDIHMFLQFIYAYSTLTAWTWVLLEKLMFAQLVKRDAHRQRYLVPSHNNTLLNAALSELKPVSTLMRCFCNSHFNIIHIILSVSFA